MELDPQNLTNRARGSSAVLYFGEAIATGIEALSALYLTLCTWRSPENFPPQELANMAQIYAKPGLYLKLL